MKFRRLITVFLLFSILFFSWSVACTWKKHQLEKQAIAQLFSEGQNVDYDVVYEELHTKYGRGVEGQNGGDPIWSILGYEVYWEDIVNNALSKGPDILGGRVTLLEVDEAFLVKKYGRWQNPEFAAVFQRAEEKVAQEGGKFIDVFCDEVTKEGVLYSYFSQGHLPGLKSRATNAGVRTVLRAQAKRCLEDAIKVLKNRLSAGHYSISETSKAQITLFANHPRKDPKLHYNINNCGELMFYRVAPAPNVIPLLSRLNKAIAEEKKAPENMVYIGQHHASPSRFACTPEHKALVEKAWKNLALDSSSGLLFFGKKTGNQEGAFYPVYFVEESAYQGDDFRVKDAKVTTERKNKGVAITLESAKAFGMLTEGMNGGQLACVLDEIVLTAPAVKNKIDGPEFQITGDKEEDSYWENIATSLRSGSLPCRLQVVEENSYSPYLGKQAQSQGFFAILLGLILILLFMLLYYAVAGLVADVALFFNMIFIVGILAQFGAKLTLAGIAGIALTIGMSIDSNVIIFEIIRAQLRKGIPLRKAIGNGYQQAYRSIIDSNLTTLATGLILYYLGEGVVQSFAITLIIGIITSFITSVLLSQLLVDLCIKVLGVERLSFSPGFTKNLFTNFRFNFLRMRRLTYIFSLCFLAGGSLLSYWQGLDYGTEFTGGKNYTVRFGGNVDSEVLEKGIRESFAKECVKEKTLQEGSLQIRKLSKGNTWNIVTNFAMGKATIDVSALVQQGIEAGSGYKFIEEGKKELTDLEAKEFSIENSSEIGATMAASSQRAAFWAVLTALLVMMLYIFFSFSNAGLAVASFLALLHDVLALFACLAIAKFFGFVYEIDQTFLSTLLTVIGYSINDTVVIFNSIRKKLKKYGTANISEVANEAINSTLSRTLITSLTTFSPVCILYFMGGIALEALAFSLLCGIVWGTYSSIFIATPLACDINNYIVPLFSKGGNSNKDKKLVQKQST